jgi:hypothetical protein
MIAAFAKPIRPASRLLRIAEQVDEEMTQPFVCGIAMKALVPEKGNIVTR